MDSLTQIVLGASVGEVVAGKKIGNKALLWGAIAGTIPDLDFLTGNFLSIVQQVEFHRSISHSILFCVLSSPLLAWILTKLYRRETTTFLDWTSLFFWCFLTHALLDCCTTWGTQLFFPFEYRVALKSIFVVDPLYTIPFIVFLIWCMFLSKENKKRRRLNYWGLGISSVYLVLTICNKLYITQVFEKSFHNQIGTFKNIQTRPAPLNNILWAANIEVDTGYYLGHYSHFDKNKEIDFLYVPKNHHLLNELPKSKELETLKRVSEGFFTIEKEEQNYIFNDLRFGVLGIENEQTKHFVFSYDLKINKSTLTVSERKKNMREGGKLMKKVWTRMLGK